MDRGQVKSGDVLCHCLYLCPLVVIKCHKTSIKTVALYIFMILQYENIRDQR